MIEQSTTYQEILKIGEAKGDQQGSLRASRKMLLLQGRKRFGSPGEEVTAAIEAIEDLQRLERLGVALLDAPSWEELLQTR